MTRTELNTSIDTVFDDDRADESLKPSMEGTELKKIADYVDQEIAKIAGVKTNGVVTSSATTPYPYLDKDINTVNSSAAGAYVVLPETAEVYKEILVFANNNASSFSILSDQDGSTKLFTSGIASKTASVSIGPNTSVRCTHINNGVWRIELI